MSILYSSIARGSKVLCGHEVPSGTNYDALVSSILPNIPVGSNAKTSYTMDSNTTINVLVENGLTFVCVCSSQAGKTLPFEFLNDLKRQFNATSLVHRAMHAGEREFDREFQPTIISSMERYSKSGSANGVGSSGGGQLSVIQSQVEEVKGVMIRNIEAVLDRGQRLEDLMVKSSNLEASASSFQKTAKRVKRKMWWRNTKTMIILALAAIIALIIIILIILFSSGVLPVQTQTTTALPRTTTLFTSPPKGA